MKILIIEDDPESRKYLEKAFKEIGYSVDLAKDGIEGYGICFEKTYDVLIIDRMLPKLDGLTLIEQLRKNHISTPVLILSALGQVDEKVKGLRSGGDDYLSKPYVFSELLARVESLARRKSKFKEEKTILNYANLKIDRMTRQVTRGQNIISLQPREYKLLEYLIDHADQVVTRTMLLEAVWNFFFDPQTNVVDVHISRLRNKIDKNFSPPLIHTIRGAGYYFGKKTAS